MSMRRGFFTEAGWVDQIVAGEDKMTSDVASSHGYAELNGLPAWLTASCSWALCPRHAGALHGLNKGAWPAQVPQDVHPAFSPSDTYFRLPKYRDKKDDSTSLISTRTSFCQRKTQSGWSFLQAARSGIDRTELLTWAMLPSVRPLRQTSVWVETQKRDFLWSPVLISTLRGNWWLFGTP